MSKWYERNPSRLVLEKKVMEGHFPGFELKMDCYRELYWFGSLESKKGNIYDIKVLYPDNYPVDEPRVSVEGIEVPRDNWTIHCSRNRVLCLFTRGYDPRTITACALLHRTKQWLDCYEVWRETKKWPGKENFVHRMSLVA